MSLSFLARPAPMPPGQAFLTFYGAQLSFFSETPEPQPEPAPTQQNPATSPTGRLHLFDPATATWLPLGPEIPLVPSGRAAETLHVEIRIRTTAPKKSSSSSSSYLVLENETTGQNLQGSENSVAGTILSLTITSTSTKDEYEYEREQTTTQNRGTSTKDEHEYEREGATTQNPQSAIRIPQSLSPLLLHGPALTSAAHHLDAFRLTLHPAEENDDEPVPLPAHPTTPTGAPLAGLALHHALARPDPLSFLPTLAAGLPAILRETWTGLPGNPLENLTTSPFYPNHPTATSRLHAPETPEKAGNHYGQRLRLLYRPPRNAAVTFHLAADDQARLLFAPGPSEIGKREIARVDRWTKFRQWTRYDSQTSVPLLLQAGATHYLEILHKEGRGGDHLSLARALDGGPIETIPPEELVPFHPQDLWPDQNQNNLPDPWEQARGLTTNPSNRPSSSSLVLESGAGILPAFNPSTNSVAGTILSPEPTSTSTKDEYEYEHEQTTTQNQATSTKDEYEYEHEQTTTQNRATSTKYEHEYEYEGATTQNPQSAIRIPQSTADPDRDHLTNADEYRHNLHPLRPDLAGAPGLLLRQTWRNLPGRSIADLTNSPRYPHQPDQNATLEHLDLARETDRFGDRIRGYFIPLRTGHHRFLLSGDDQAELFLGTNQSKFTKRRIAHLPRWTPRKTYTTHPTQISEPIHLTAGRPHYLEILRKENTGNDHLAVAIIEPAAEARQGDKETGRQGEENRATSTKDEYENEENDEYEAPTFPLSAFRSPLFPSPRLLGGAYLAAFTTDPLDQDDDDLPDAWEQKHGFDTTIPNNPQADTDEDGLTDAEEVHHATDPRKEDSDGNGHSDYLDERFKEASQGNAVLDINDYVALNVTLADKNHHDDAWRLYLAQGGAGDPQATASVDKLDALVTETQTGHDYLDGLGITNYKNTQKNYIEQTAEGLLFLPVGRKYAFKLSRVEAGQVEVHDEFKVDFQELGPNAALWQYDKNQSAPKQGALPWFHLLDDDKNRTTLPTNGNKWGLATTTSKAKAWEEARKVGHDEIEGEKAPDPGKLKWIATTNPKEETLLIGPDKDNLAEPSTGHPYHTLASQPVTLALKTNYKLKKGYPVIQWKHVNPAGLPYPDIHQWELEQINNSEYLYASTIPAETLAGGVTYTFSLLFNADEKETKQAKIGASKITVSAYLPDFPDRYNPRLLVDVKDATSTDSLFSILENDDRDLDIDVGVDENGQIQFSGKTDLEYISDNVTGNHGELKIEMEKFQFENDMAKIYVEIDSPQGVDPGWLSVHLADDSKTKAFNLYLYDSGQSNAEKYVYSKFNDEVSGDGFNFNEDIKIEDNKNYFPKNRNKKKRFAWIMIEGTGEGELDEELVSLSIRYKNNEDDFDEVFVPFSIKKTKKIEIPFIMSSDVVSQMNPEIHKAHIDRIQRSKAARPHHLEDMYKYERGSNTVLRNDMDGINLHGDVQIPATLKLEYSVFNPEVISLNDADIHYRDIKIQGKTADYGKRIRTDPMNHILISSSMDIINIYAGKEGSIVFGVHSIGGGAHYMNIYSKHDRDGYYRGKLGGRLRYVADTEGGIKKIHKGLDFIALSAYCVKVDWEEEVIQKNSLDPERVEIKYSGLARGFGEMIGLKYVEDEHNLMQFESLDGIQLKGIHQFVNQKQGEHFLETGKKFIKARKEIIRNGN